MDKFLRWAGIILGSFLGLAVVALGIVYYAMTPFFCVWNLPARGCQNLWCRAKGCDKWGITKPGNGIRDADTEAR